MYSPQNWLTAGAWTKGDEPNLETIIFGVSFLGCNRFSPRACCPSPNMKTTLFWELGLVFELWDMIPEILLQKVLWFYYAMVGDKFQVPSFFLGGGGTTKIPAPKYHVVKSPNDWTRLRPALCCERHRVHSNNRSLAKWRPAPIRTWRIIPFSKCLTTMAWRDHARTWIRG